MDKTAVAMKRFNAFVHMARLAGIPLLNTNASKIYYLHTFLTVTLCYGTFVALLVFMIIYDHDLNQVTQNALYFIGCFNILVIDVHLRHQRKDLDELLELTSEFTWDTLPSREPTTHNLTMAGMIPWIKKTLCWNFFGVFSLHIAYCTVRLSTETGRPLTIAVAQPLDLSSDFNYWMVNAFQIYAALLFGSVFYGFLGLFSMLVAIACSQLEKLRITLEDINCSNEDQLHSELASCLLLHQKVMRFSRRMEVTMSPIILAHYITLTFGICFCAFVGVISWSRHGAMMQIVIFFDTYVLQLFIYCWLGNQLTFQFESVKHAVWNMDWIGTPVKFQRNLLFLTMFTNYGFYLTAGRIAVVSLSTMLKILNQSYSFLMFLISFRRNSHHSVDQQ